MAEHGTTVRYRAGAWWVLATTRRSEAGRCAARLMFACRERLSVMRGTGVALWQLRQARVSYGWTIFQDTRRLASCVAQRYVSSICPAMDGSRPWLAPAPA